MMYLFLIVCVAFILWHRLLQLSRPVNLRSTEELTRMMDEAIDHREEGVRLTCVRCVVARACSFVSIRLIYVGVVMTNRSTRCGSRG